MREKVISYRITVTPPNRDSVIKGRRRRAVPCLKAVQKDLQELKLQTKTAKAEKEAKRNLVEKLKKQLEDAQEDLKNAEKEEAALLEREKLRKEQESALLQRVQKGWPDEKASS
jgi:predicted nuclease with TOPRIM domain